MKKLIATALLACLLVMSSNSIAFATDLDPAKIEDASSFNVFDILSVDDEDNGEHLTETLVAEAEEAGTSAVGALILRAINILSLLVGTFAFVMIIIGGFMWSTSGGNETQIDKGKAILTQAIVGLFIAFLAYFIVTFILSFFYV